MVHSQFYPLGKTLTYGRQRRWKGYEAVLFSVGAVAEDILELLQDREKYQHVPPFDLAQLFQAAVLPFLQSHGKSWTWLQKTYNSLPDTELGHG